MNDDDLDEFIAALQDVVLPVGVPVLPGLDLAAHFSVPADPGESTGAWFDVVVLRSGRVALTMGQVPGSGLGTVAAAAAVSAVLRAGLLCHEDVVAALRLADMEAEHSADSRGTSAVLAVVDLRAGELIYATAGRDAPVLATGDGGPSRLLPRAGGGALGSGAEIVAGRQRLETGDLVVLSSGAGPTAGPVADLVDQTRVAGDSPASCEALADRLGRDQSRGAVAVVAAGVTENRSADLDLDLALDDATSRQARRELEGWLATLGVTPMESLSLTHATAELVANSVEHSRDAGDSAGTVRVHAAHVDDGAVVVEVVDRGRWRVARDDIARGRGLAMAAGLVDDLAVTSDDGGTRARIRQRLSRPVLIERASVAGAWPTAAPLSIRHTGLGAVRLAGEFGHDDVDQVSHALLLASRGLTQVVDVDLSEVTSISAGGLRVLDEIVRDAADQGAGHTSVTLHAPRGSASQVELERAGIAHRAS